jgi:RimJ/RimL family protein N-acetyltransferase
MTMPADWNVAHLTDKALVRRFLNRDRVYSAYMLGDLDDALWQHCAFYAAVTPSSPEATGLVLRFTGFTPNLLVLAGDAQAVEALLMAAPDDQPVYFTATEPLYPIFQQHYTTPDSRHMWRMAWQEGSDLLPYTGGAVHLTGAEGIRLIAELFRQVDGSAGVFFTPEQVNDCAFFGVLDGDRLVAVSGTHVVSTRESVAAVGNILTLPAYRGRGYATQCTAATTHYLAESGIQTIVLNVNQDNRTAIRIYEKLGYGRALPFWEGPGIPRHPGS